MLSDEQYLTNAADVLFGNQHPSRIHGRALTGQSAESAIGFGGRLQRHHSTGLCGLGVVFDPHRPYQNPIKTALF